MKHVTRTAIVIAIFFAFLGEYKQFVQVAEAACTGSIICCQRYGTVYGPDNCDPSCDPNDPYVECTPCTEEEYGCVQEQPSSCQFIAGECASGVFCDQGQVGGSCEEVADCGNGVCSAGETCASCPADCSCASGPVCGDGACATTETPASCPSDCDSGAVCGNGICDSAEGENCSNCAADCTVGCGTCGDGVCTEAPCTCDADCGSCSSGDFCGDGECNNGENCSSCSSDCGSCSSTNFCGDGSCTGSEQCDLCVADCGLCATGSSWYQVSGGSIFAGLVSGTAVESNIPASTCVEPVCKPYLMITDANDTADSVGMVVTGGGAVETGGYTTEGASNIVVVGSPLTRLRENYAYFYRRFSLGLSPTDDFTAAGGNDPANAQKPTFDANKKYYFHSGDMTINDEWDVAAGETYVVFVDGDVTFTDPDGIDQLTDVANGGVLVFIVSGNILIDNNVNRPVNSSLANLEGIFIADGQVVVQTNNSGIDDLRFNGEGTFVGWLGINLQRNLSDADNETAPAEYFTYRPDIVENVPDEMKRSQIIWQETN